MVVRDDVSNFLATANPTSLNIFVASCAERMAQVATGLLAESGGRQADVAVCVDAVDALWLTARSQLHEGVNPEVLDGFPELQPHEEGLSDIRDIYVVYSLLALKYALQCASGEGVSAAERCAHISLTAMDQLTKNTSGVDFFKAEMDRQGVLISVLSGDPDVVDLDAVRTTDRAMGSTRIAAILARVR